MAVQVLRHAATTMRRAQCDDASRFPPRMILKQRANQDAAQTVTHQMHGISVERIEKMRQLHSIGMEIGTDGSVGKRMNNKSLTA